MIQTETLHVTDYNYIDEVVRQLITITQHRKGKKMKIEEI